MTKTHSCVTVVPVYKERPSKTEAYSLMQLRLLDVQNVTLMCPEGLDTSFYTELWPELSMERFPKNHFLSVQTYNDFLLDPAFYETFYPRYEWLFIYQLDAFLFENRIDHFCDLNYDYYGAPWRYGIVQYRFLFNRYRIKINRKRFYVGNGGFCLRKLASTIDLLYRKKGDITQTSFMEDVFFGYWGSRDPNFHTCPPKIAAEFSIETYPEYWIEVIGRMPMGTHNIERGGPEFGKAFYASILQERYSKLSQAFEQLNQL
ncbi:DUF5672 family protein [Polynucleobacter sp. AP-Kolm-20A-A1]|uniref:DUF5672 family protein n=1 Tax=Polynucleobacter sp. AP-Kolm-20A-A1 TaxID=2081041 RepID=UPI001BFE418B|nr:DUF5672 family protein [Polynucleobacter sp. AP-Kolm-20A-A1]QWE20913.1 hypothetical protein C2745_01595 [Polynucleobacter sp. AP-Kolm-20A-A1]